MPMKRKVIRQGGGGLTMYLPKAWTEQRKLRPGDELEVLEDGDELVISARGADMRSREIDVSGQNKSRVRTALSAAYRRGYDEIVLVGSGLSLSSIEEVVASLMGLVIVEQSPTRIKIRNTIADDFDSLPGVLGKMFVTAGYLLKCQDPAEAEGLRRQVMRLRDYCQRMIHLKVFAKDRAFEYYTLVAVLEKVSVHAAGLASSRKRLPVVAEVEELLRRLHAAIVKGDSKMAFSANDRLGVLEKSSGRLDAKTALLVSDAYMLSSRVVGVLV